MKFLNSHTKKLFIGIAMLILLNIGGSYLYKRFDLTQDQRYTLSEASLNTVKDIEEPIVVDVFLKGSFPAEFKKLQIETRQLLEEFEAYNPLIEYNFVDPLEDEASAEAVTQQMIELGLTPAQATVTENNKVSQELVFPWAIANYKQKTVRIPLLKNTLGATSEERVSNSVQHLEYAFADGFSKLTNTSKKKIAILKGNNELPDIFIADFLTSIREYYNVAPFDIKALGSDYEQTLTNLQRFDLMVVAKPTKAFTEEEKYVLDQYTMNGGKSLWLVDAVHVEMDSLFNEKGKTLAFPRNLNLDDMFFRYGARINPVVTKDLYHAPIVLATGDGTNSQYNPVPWFYNVLTVNKNTHPITNNTGSIKFEFVNQIDLLDNNNGVSKQVLLTSSPLSKTVGIPFEISLNEIRQQPDQASYSKGNQTLAALLEGTFTSTYKNRVKPFKFAGNIDDGKDAKMIIVADGDVIKNQLRNGQPLELGYDKWTNNYYGNKEFLLNCVNYLLDDSGLINIRSKEIAVAFLDKEKVVKDQTFWKSVNIGLPLLLLALFGFVFNWMRRRKFA